MSTISFKPQLALAVILGQKIQTRRGIAQGITLNNSGQPVILSNPSWTLAVYSVNSPIGKPRIKWRVGMKTPIKASRTGKALGYVTLDTIRIQDVRDMTHADAVDEACTGLYPNEPFNDDPRSAFWYTWLSLNKLPRATFRDLTLLRPANERHCLDRCKGRAGRRNHTPCENILGFGGPPVKGYGLTRTR